MTDENTLLALAMRKGGDEGREARHRLIERNMGLARVVAGWYEPAHCEREDLFQIACVGLVKAADNYDPDKGFAFSTYAVWCMKRSISRSIENEWQDVRLPRWAYAARHTLERDRRALAQELGREPGVSDLAAITTTPANARMSSREWVSCLLDMPYVTARLDDTTRGGRRIPSPSPSPCEAVEASIALDKALGALGRNQRYAVLGTAYGYQDREMAKAEGCSPQAIQIRRKRGMEKMREAIAHDL